MKMTRILLALGIMAAVPGCVSCCQDHFDNCTANVRNCWHAHLAWKDWSWTYCDLPYSSDFKNGFKTGYRDICEGATGSQPTHPPRRYWNVVYQNAEGHCRINSWFEGYSHGVLAATQDGFAGASVIPVSPTTHMNMERMAWERKRRYEADRGRQREHARRVWTSDDEDNYPELKSDRQSEEMDRDGLDKQLPYEEQPLPDDSTMVPGYNGYFPVQANRSVYGTSIR